MTLQFLFERKELVSSQLSLCLQGKEAGRASVKASLLGTTPFPLPAQVRSPSTGSEKLLGTPLWERSLHSWFQRCWGQPDLLRVAFRSPGDNSVFPSDPDWD